MKLFTLAHYSQKNISRVNSIKNFFYLIFFFTAPIFSTAQRTCPTSGPVSLPFVAGEILIDYVGSSDSALGTKYEPAFQACGTTVTPNDKWYEITLNYFIECIPGKDFENEYTLYAINDDLIRKNDSPSTKGIICFSVNFDKNLTSNTRCVVGQPLCTEGERFKGRIALPESETPWKIVFGYTRDVVIPNSGGKRRAIQFGNSAHSSASMNIVDAQAFMVKSEVLVYCKDITTTATQNPPNVTVRNNLYNNRSAYISTDEMIESFCNSQEYAFQLPINDTNEVKDLDTNGLFKKPKADSLDFKLHGAYRNFGTVNYAQPYTSTNPLPSPFGEPLRVSDDGFFTYEPELPKGEQSFFGIVTYKVSEFRKAWHLDDVNTPNGTVKTLVYRYPVVPNSFPPEFQPAIVTYKQFMFVIDTNCAKNLPNFSSHTWNADEKAWEFNCNQNIITLDLSEPVLAASVNRLDFRLVRGDTNIVDNNLLNIDSILPLNISATGETEKLRIVVNDNGTFGPGRYSLFTKLGNDKNTLLNRCGFELDENVIFPVYINNHFDYEYLDYGNTVDICHPQMDIELYPLIGQSDILRGGAFEFTVTYTENRPNPPPYDTSWVGEGNGVTSPRNTYREKIEVDQTSGNLILKEGKWTIGVGKVYYSFNIQYKEVCYGEDDIELRILENVPNCTPPIDVELAKLNVQDTLKLNKAVDIVGTVKNVGLYDITSFELNWSVNQGTINTQTINLIHIKQDSSYNFTHDIKYIPTDVSKENLLKVWVSLVNERSLLNNENDTLTKEFAIVVGLNEKNHFVNDLKIYPNPTSNKATVQFQLSETREVKVELLSVTGKSVYLNYYSKLNPGSQLITVDISALKNGIYFLNLETDNKKLFRKIVISK